MDKKFQERFRFFLKHGASVVGEAAMCALRLARAEVEAEKRGWKFHWPYDDDADLGDHEVWCKAARVTAAMKAGRPVIGRNNLRRAHPPECDHYVRGCHLEAEGFDKYEVALWGNIDMDATSMRVVEAELALQALGELHARERVARARWEGVLEAARNAAPGGSAFVKVNVVDGFGQFRAKRQTFYLPVKYREPQIRTGPTGHYVDGGLSRLLGDEDMPTGWGFDTEAEAQQCVDAWKDRQAELEAEGYASSLPRKRDGEDFHADG